MERRELSERRERERESKLEMNRAQTSARSDDVKGAAKDAFFPVPVKTKIRNNF